MKTLKKRSKSSVYPKRHTVPDWKQDPKNFILLYVPQRILDLNMTWEYLEEAIAMYLVKRIEPEELLKRHLGNKWNLFGHEEVVMAVENVTVQHTWGRGDLYTTLYYFADGDTRKAHEQAQLVRAMVVEHAEGPSATPLLWVEDIQRFELYTFDFDEFAWTRESCAEHDIYDLTYENQAGVQREKSYGMRMTLI